MSAVVSVVIPTYNQALLLKEALRSVFIQTLQDFEIIVVNNYSTDETEEVVKSFQDPRMRLINFKNEGIIAKSRNRGIKISSAPLIAFLDSDDTWYPTKLERCVSIFKQDKQVILVGHDEDVMNDGKVISCAHRGAASDAQMYESLLFQGNSISTSATVVKKDALLSVGGFSENPDFIGVEDYDLWLRLAKAGKFYFIPEALGVFRLHESSHTAANLELSYRRTINVVEHHIKQLSDRELQQHRPGIKQARAQAKFNVGWAALTNDNYGEAKMSFTAAIKSKPLSLKPYAGLLLAAFRFKAPVKWYRKWKGVTHG